MKRLSPILAGALLFFLLASAARLVPLNQDEGWYLLAAQRIHQGLTPYTDFTFTQAPALPYVYQLFLPLARTHGLYGARLGQALLLTLTALILLRTLRPKTPAETLPVLALLLAPLYVQFGLTVKTYALTALLLLAAAACWLRGPRSNPLTAAALLLALATATRLSFGIAFVPLSLSLLARRKTLGDTAWITFTAAGAAGLLLFLGPFLLRDPSAFLYQTLSFHAARDHAFPSAVHLGFLLRPLHTLLPLLGVFLLLRPAFRTLPAEERTLWYILPAVAILHFIAPHPYDEYLTPLYPLAVLLIARAALRHPLPTAPLHGFTALILLFHLSSPHLHAWIPLKTDRIWVQADRATDLDTLEHAARILNKLLPEDAILYTPDTYLAIEARLDVPRGLEMGPFSFKLHAPHPAFLDWDGIEQALAQSDAAAFTAYHFIHSPEIRPFSPEEEARFRDLLARDFTHIQTIDRFGQNRLPLEIWLRKSPH
ncbi:MAG: hypothetical protein JJU05_06875 [Verrucomicrobia bacterium]|nr:hypothetical protein [Verrucomicrobiota bacterium]MCH8527029.1 hypothetical protein [Kiritimatiellia bacterium]